MGREGGKKKEREYVWMDVLETGGSILGLEKLRK